MNPKNIFKLIGLLVSLSMILAACAPAATPTAAPVETEPPAPVETAAPEPATTEAPEPVAPEATEAPSAGEPTDLAIAAILTIGLEEPWDRSWYDSMQRVIAAKPHGLNITLDYTEGVWGDEAEQVLR